MAGIIARQGRASSRICLRAPAEVFFQKKFHGVGDRLKQAAGPTRFGPSRSWIKAMIRRSA